MTKILFLCPHNAAKSILAAAYATKLAQQRGLNLTIDTAGTEPSEQVSPKVLEFLKTQAMDFSTIPRKVNSDDIRSATHIISMGCDLQDLPLHSETLEQWDDITPVSQDLEAAWQRITSRVQKLLETLA